MKRFTKRGKDMNPKWEGIFYVTVEQKIARFIELHVNSNNNRITFTPERFKELTEYVGRTKTPIKNHNLKSLREANLIKFVWVNGSGCRVYMLNPEWSNQLKDSDQEKYIEFYNKLVDGNLEYNDKIRRGYDNIEGELGDNGIDQVEEESNKSNNEGEDPKGEPKEIVVHPEEEVKVQVQGYNPVTTPDMLDQLVDYAVDHPETTAKEEPKEEPERDLEVLEQLIDYVVDNAPEGIDKNKLGRWCQKGNLMSWLESKLAMHKGADPGEIVNYYMTSGSLSELYDTFSHKKQ